MALTIGEYVRTGLVAVGVVILGEFGPKLAESYLPTQTLRIEYQPMYPHASSKTTVEFDIGASLVDETGDGLPDRKTRVAASRQGFHRWNLPITEKDKQIFKDLTSRLK